MTDYHVKQLAPNHASHIEHFNSKKLATMLSDEIAYAQPKYDGERMLIHIDGENVYCTSRRFSKKTDRYMENQDKLPVLKELLRPIMNDGYIVLDCECYSDTWADAVGILHSLPDRAVELQKTVNLKFAIFDCLYAYGVDIREERYDFRLVVAEKFVSRLKTEQLHIVKPVLDLQITNMNDAVVAFDYALSQGLEGIVVKSNARKYYDSGASLKMKQTETLDCVVCGYQQGRGKYENMIGALYIGYYDADTDSVIKISKVNCGTDAERKMWTDNFDAMIHSVIEVKCQEVTDKSLRHPVYLRLRNDKDYRTCTKDTIFK